MTGIKERGRFSLTNGQSLADGAQIDTATLARMTGLSPKAVSDVLSGKTSTWVRCAKVVRALAATGAKDADESAIARQDG